MWEELLCGLAKDSALLSSPDGYFLETTEWPKGHSSSHTELYTLKIYAVYCLYGQSHFSCVRLFVTLWTIACQAPLFLGFSRQEYWSGLLCPPSEDLPNPGILRLLHWQRGSLPLAPPGYVYHTSIKVLRYTIFLKKDGQLETP